MFNDASWIYFAPLAKSVYEYLIISNVWKVHTLSWSLMLKDSITYFLLKYFQQLNY